MRRNAASFFCLLLLEEFITSQLAHEVQKSACIAARLGQTEYKIVTFYDLAGTLLPKALVKFGKAAQQVIRWL